MKRFYIHSSTLSKMCCKHGMSRDVSGGMTFRERQCIISPGSSGHGTAPWTIACSYRRIRHFETSMTIVTSPPLFSMLHRLRLPSVKPLSAVVVAPSAKLATPRWQKVCPTFSTSSPLRHPKKTFFRHSYTMAGNYELLCLENPLLDIQGVGYVKNYLRSWHKD